MSEQVVTRATSNPDFARRVGIHYTMASRIRNGQRTPSTGLLSRIIEAFDLQGDDLAACMNAVGAGPEAFGTFVRERLYAPDAAPD